MNRVFLVGIALGAAAATAAWGAGALFQSPSGRGAHLYEVNYYTPRQPFPDESGYSLREGDPGVAYPDYDNSYLRSMLSRCRVREYVISIRGLPNGGRMSTARFWDTAGSQPVTCMNRFVDERSFVHVEAVTR